MMPFIEEIKVFVERNCYKPYQILHHHNLDEAHTNDWWIVIRKDRGKRLFNFHSRPMDLLTLDVIALMCSSNVKDVSNIKPKCVLWWNLLNWFIIKKNWWMYNLFDLTGENNFWRLFRWVRVETHFPLEIPVLYFIQILTKLFSFCIWIIY